MDGAEGVTITGHWINDAGEGSDSFLLVLPDTQDRWVPFFREVRAPQDGQQLRLVIERRWVVAKKFLEVRRIPC